MRRHCLIPMGIGLAASIALSAARAEIGAEPRQPQSTAPSDPAATTPEAPKTTTGLPSAPPEKMRTGVGSRALTGGNPGPGPTKPVDPAPVR